MRREDLFLAIGQMEDSRLLRSELAVQSASEAKTEEKVPMKKHKSTRILRRLLIAAVMVSLLAVTAFAVGGFLIFDSPTEMITAIFGDETGFDHSEGSIRPDPEGPPTGILVEPTFDRVPVDETVADEKIVPNVQSIGQSVSFGSYTLTVDAFMYDSATHCGFFTYLLENPDGVSGYKLQSNGEIWYEGVPDIVQVNQYGYPIIIQEKTTDTCLAATYYFEWDARRGENLEISLQSTERYTPEEFETLIADEVEDKKQKMTPEEVVESVRQKLGEADFQRAFEGLTGEALAEQCYLNLTAWEVSERMEKESASEVISVSLAEERSLPHITAGEGSIVLSPIAIRVDITDLDFLHTDSHGTTRIDVDSIDSLAIHFQDGTEYTVYDDYLMNYFFASADMPEENVQTEVFVSAEDDPAGEAYYTVENSHGYCLLTVMFNRIIDTDNVSAVVLNGTVLPVD